MNWALMIIGLIIVIVGIIAGTYQVTEDSILGEDTEIPYNQFMIPLIVIGIGVMIVGAFVGEKYKRVS